MDVILCSSDVECFAAEEEVKCYYAEDVENCSAAGKDTGYYDADV